MRRTQQGHAWIYWDCRRKDTEGYWFVMISASEIDRAIKELSSAGALKVYLYVLKMVNGKTMQRFTDGQILGEQMIAEACGISRATMYRATKELEKAGLLSITKFGGETRALLVSPQKGIEVDHRRSIKNEKKTEKNKKLQSQIRDCAKSQNLDDSVQLCQKSQSQIRHNDLDPLKINYPLYSPPSELAYVDDTGFKKLARSKGAESGKEKKEEDTKPESFLEGVEPTLINALCSILARSEQNLNNARISPFKTVISLTTKSRQNSRSLLNQEGWYGSHSKRRIQRVLEGVLSVYFNDKTISATLKKYKEGATMEKLQIAPKTQKRTNPLNDVYLKEYEKEIREYQNLPKDNPNRYAKLLQLLNNLERVETEFTLTKSQSDWLQRLCAELIE